jgi:hypothetical protein
VNGGQQFHAIGCLKALDQFCHARQALLRFGGVTPGALAPDIDKTGSLITHLPVIGWLTRPASRLAEVIAPLIKAQQIGVARGHRPRLFVAPFVDRLYPAANAGWALCGTT